MVLLFNKGLNDIVKFWFRMMIPFHNYCKDFCLTCTKAQDLMILINLFKLCLQKINSTLHCELEKTLSKVIYCTIGICNCGSDLWGENITWQIYYYLPFHNFPGVCIERAEPNSSVSSIADLRTGGGWFDPQLGQYSF